MRLSLGRQLVSTLFLQVWSDGGIPSNSSKFLDKGFRQPAGIHAVKITKALGYHPCCYGVQTPATLRPLSETT